MGWDRRGVLVSLGALAAAAAAPAQWPADPAQPIRLLEAALAGSANAMPSAGSVRAAVTRAFDTEAIARAVLAGLAANATAAQLGRFREALTDRIVRDLLKRRRSDGRGTLAIVRSRPTSDGGWLVTSQLRLPARHERTVSWRVRAGARGPVISDVLGSGTSMVRVLRNEYAPALRRLGLDGLIARMEARNRRAGG